MGSRGVASSEITAVLPGASLGSVFEVPVRLNLAAILAIRAAFLSASFLFSEASPSTDDPLSDSPKVLTLASGSSCDVLAARRLLNAFIAAPPPPRRAAAPARAPIDIPAIAPSLRPDESVSPPGIAVLVVMIAASAESVGAVAVVESSESGAGSEESAALLLCGTRIIAHNIT